MGFLQTWRERLEAAHQRAAADDKRLYQSVSALDEIHRLLQRKRQLELEEETIILRAEVAELEARANQRRSTPK